MYTTASQTIKRLSLKRQTDCRSNQLFIICEHCSLQSQYMMMRKWFILKLINIYIYSMLDIYIHIFMITFASADILPTWIHIIFLFSSIYMIIWFCPIFIVMKFFSLQIWIIHYTIFKLVYSNENYLIMINHYVQTIMEIHTF